MPQNFGRSVRKKYGLYFIITRSLIVVLVGIFATICYGTRETVRKSGGDKIIKEFEEGVFCVLGGCCQHSVHSVVITMMRKDKPK